MPERQNWSHTTGRARVWDAKSASRWVFGALLLVLFCANAAGQATSPSPRPGDLRVRPCTPNEVAFGSSQVDRFLRWHSREALLRRFSRCEAVEVAWFPAATILRLHAAVDPESSLIYTVVRAGENAPVHVMAAGEGLTRASFAGSPADVRTFNQLLRRAPQPFSSSRLESACVLYLFLVGQEDSFRTFPEWEHGIATADYDPQQRQKDDSVQLTTRRSQWRFVFSRHGGRAQVKAVLMGARLPD